MGDEIRAFLSQHGAGGDMGSVGDEESLLDAGIIDSAAMVDLITFLESQYGITIEDDDMVPENFDSIRAIGDYVKSVKAQ